MGDDLSKFINGRLEMNGYIGEFLAGLGNGKNIIVWVTGPAKYVTYYNRFGEDYVIATRTLESYLEEILK